MGEFHLRKQYAYASVDPEDITLNNVIHPDSIIDLLRAKLTLEKQSDTGSSCVKNKENQTDENIECADTDAEPKATRSKTIAQESLANKVLLDKGITLVPEFGGFMVKGSENRLYAVTLFPTETCQCPSTTRCYHIIAAMKSIGMSIHDKKKRTINLSRLRKRSRKNNDKGMGRKKPRIGDLDESIIIPAPDSIINISNYSTPNSIVKPITSTPETPKSILKKEMTSNKSRKKLRFEESCNKMPHSDEVIDLNKSISIELDEHNITSKDDIWNEELYLKKTDRDDIINDAKLSSTHIEAVNVLIGKQFSNKINGFQLTEKIPFFDENNGRWHISNVMEAVHAPACQIHHTHKDHWVVSFYDLEIFFYLTV